MRADWIFLDLHAIYCYGRTLSLIAHWELASRKDRVLKWSKDNSTTLNAYTASFVHTSYTESGFRIQTDRLEHYNRTERQQMHNNHSICRQN